MASVQIDPSDYIDEINTNELVSELRRRFKAGEKIDKEIIERLFEEDETMKTAMWRFKRGDYEDALFYLESALGNDWIGLSDILRRRAA